VPGVVVTHAGWKGTREDREKSVLSSNGKGNVKGKGKGKGNGNGKGD
jgi:hypothetical protein